ncbi:hypothetical protein [Xanthomonas tesorieronis]
MIVTSDVAEALDQLRQPCGVEFAQLFRL